MAGSITGFPYLSFRLDLIVTFSAKHSEINNPEISTIRIKHFLYMIVPPVFACNFPTLKIREKGI
jgi:hypothetical protein